MKTGTVDSSSSFNPRPCARGDAIRMGNSPSSGCFNPRPCARGDRVQTMRTTLAQRFNPRPCARGDTGADIEPNIPRVSIHAPARGATRSAAGGDEGFVSFNPRPCARGDRLLRHHPTTRFRFQSTPLREGRLARSSTGWIQPSSFNPRPCARGDGHTLLLWSLSHVSIHAPARGATASRGVSSPPKQFQSTPLREGRRAEGVSRSRIASFNPRPCARGDSGFAARIA